MAKRRTEIENAVESRLSAERQRIRKSQVEAKSKRNAILVSDSSDKRFKNIRQLEWHFKDSLPKNLRVSLIKRTNVPSDRMERKYYNGSIGMNWILKFKLHEGSSIFSREISNLIMVINSCVDPCDISCHYKGKWYNLVHETKYSSGRDLLQDFDELTKIIEKSVFGWLSDEQSLSSHDLD